MSRVDGRAVDELRPHRFDVNFLKNASGSVLVESGNTRVLCAVSVEPGVPRWMKEQGVGGGWLTCEYQMLPAAGGGRSKRGPNGRSQEIQRLIGRSLRGVIDLSGVGANTIYVDCDVIDADGGTRCASINGAMVAVRLALGRMFIDKQIKTIPIRENLAAISVGIVDGEPMLDLCYKEDVSAAVDMNVVMTAGGRFVEVQGTAESEPFTRSEMEAMMALAEKGIQKIVELQQSALG